MDFKKDNFIFNYGMDFSKEGNFNNLIDGSKEVVSLLLIFRDITLRTKKTAL